MTHGGPEFIEILQKNNKMTYIYFTFVLLGGGGGKINRPGQLAPVVMITMVGGKISRDRG